MAFYFPDWENFSASKDKTATTVGHKQYDARKQSRLRYYWTMIRWMYQHRAEPDNRQKWRRMQKEIEQ